MDLNRYDMVLRIQLLIMFGNIVSNYKKLWMSFFWQGQQVLLKGNNLIPFQTIRVEQLKSLLNSNTQVDGVSLCSLRLLRAEDKNICSLTTTSLIHEIKFPDLVVLLASYKEIFQEPKGLPLYKGHDHAIPIKASVQPVNLRPYRYSGL